MLTKRQEQHTLKTTSTFQQKSICTSGAQTDVQKVPQRVGVPTANNGFEQGKLQLVAEIIQISK